MITADQIVAHLVGDYILQSHWMATEKTKRSIAALVHVICYSLPFLFLTLSPAALAVIVVTHFVIDRWRLARYVIWVKNFVGPRRKMIPKWSCTSCDNIESSEREVTCWQCGDGEMVFERRIAGNPPWAECSATGYAPDVPPWLSVWLLIIVDNTMHLLCNGLAIHYLG